MWECFPVVVVADRHRHRHRRRRVVAIAPVINIRVRACERTYAYARNSFNELDFARRANSFLHLHSRVPAVNHFSARLTRHVGEKVEFD